jgi:hypothetical protein
MDGETWSRYLLSEDLVLSKLSAELGRPINRGLRFSVPNGPRFIFDGAVIEGNKLTIIEVKVTKDPIVALGRLSNSLTRIFRMFPELPQETRENFAVILAIVSQKEGIDKDHIATKLRGLIGPTPAPLQVRIFTFDELSKDSHAASQV